MTKYQPRELAPMIARALEDMPVVVVTGMRQTGKSTMLQSDARFQNRRYLSLDDFARLAAAKTDPEAFVASDEPLTIDEAQRCPDLLLAIKREVDRDRRPGRFLLSGSANFALLAGVVESLAGRAVYFHLGPFSMRERRDAPNSVPALRAFMNSGNWPAGSARPVSAREVFEGGMPPVALGSMRDTSLWFKGYEQTYLERDLRDLSQVADLLAFRQLMRLSALRTGQLLQASELAREAKLTASTAIRYLGLLEASFVVRRVQPFLGNRASRLIKSPKLYVSDSGLACYLAGIDRAEALAEDPLAGAIFETYAAQNLSALLEAHWPLARLAFWNVQGRHEVDFVIEVGRDCVAIEIKAASRWNDKALSGLRAFLHLTPRCRAGILGYNGTETVRLGDRLWAVPLSVLLG
ncbi:MAG: ATPase [Elusimicrobia bacterium CG22_combo_CG10-13_8_21_14_all_63_91]|nr:MAG: ATPase [Elusimicrobia bacterium CG22_combo_CG10-13_8_21_14_all_63_91]